MKRFTSVFALGLAATLALSSCNTAKDVADGAADAVGAAGDVAGDVAGGAVDAAGDVAGAAGDVAGGAVDAAGDVAGGAVDAVGDVASGAADTVGDVASGTVETLGNVAAGATGAAGGGLVALKDGVTGMTTSITSTVDSVKSGDFAAAKESFSGVETAWGNLKSVIPGDAAGIEEKIAEVSTGLSADAPDKDSVLSSLGGLKDLVGGLAK